MSFNRIIDLLSIDSIGINKTDNRETKRDKILSQWFIYEYNDECNLNNTCLCGESIRHVFIIKNKYNKRTHNIGSSCILKFNDNEFNDYVSYVLKPKKSQKVRNKPNNKRIVGINDNDIRKQIDDDIKDIDFSTLNI
jgi:hypothetical protein